MAPSLQRRRGRLRRSRGIQLLAPHFTGTRARDTGERPYAQELVRIDAANGSLKVLAALPHSVDRFRYFVVDWGAPHFTCAPGFVTIYTGGGFAKVPLEGGGFEPLLKIVKPQYAGWTTRSLKSQVEEAQLSPDGKLALILDDRQLYLLAVLAAGRKKLTLDLSAPATAQTRLTDIGADFFGWSPDGRYIDWAIGSTFYRIRFSEELFEQNSAPRRVPCQFDHHRDARKRRSECL